MILVDGTRLPGIAIVSYANPFGGPGDDDARNNVHEAEADLCLALEMLRNQPLHIASVATDRGPAPDVTLPGHKQTNWVASGDVRVYVDPREAATWSFFQRIFCFDADFVQASSVVPDTGVQRSAQVLTVSLQSTLLAHTVDSNPFAALNAASTPHSEFAIFAQPVPASELADASTGQETVPIRLVLGRRVAIQTRRAGASKELARSRSFHRQPSIGSQTLHDVFSQAGLSLPTFGGISTLPSTTAPRPDDPLPRGSISGLLQARSKRKPTHTQRNVGTSPSVSSSLEIPPPLGARTPGRRGEKRRADRTAGPTPAPAESVSPEPFLLDLEDADASKPLDRINRHLIKKVVHTLLVREHGLTKSHADYTATYNQTCSGTWCTFRNIATTTRLSKDAVENVVRIHLSLYLYSSEN